MRTISHRHLGKVMAGAAVAATATAVMIAVTLPGDASGDSRAARGGNQGTTAERGGQPGQAPAVVESAAPQGPTGSGRDPLTDDETRRAEQIARGRTFRGGGEDVTGKTGPQQLATDLAELPPEEVGRTDAHRRANVTFYDYKDDAYVTKTVDLDTGKVDHTETQHGVQPPLSRAETDEAARLLIADPLGDGLRKDFQDATGSKLTGPSQLTVTGFVYRVDAERPGPAGLAECGKHRCVRLFTRVTNGPWIDTRQLVVDLSDRAVTRLS